MQNKSIAKITIENTINITAVTNEEQEEINIKLL